MSMKSYVDAARAGKALDLARMPFRQFIDKVSSLRTRDLNELQDLNANLKRRLLNVQMQASERLPLLFCLNNQMQERYVERKYESLSRRIDLLFASTFQMNDPVRFNTCRKFIFRLLDNTLPIPDSGIDEYSPVNTVTCIFYTLSYLRSCSSRDELIVAVLCVQVLKSVISVKSRRVKVKGRSYILRTLITRVQEESYLGLKLQTLTQRVLKLIAVK